jgi:hypothetical protein
MSPTQQIIVRTLQMVVDLLQSSVLLFLIHRSK